MASRPVLVVKKFLFDEIVTNNKTVDGRIATDKHRRIKLGHEIEFQSGSLRCVRKVIKQNLYNSFEELLLNEGMENCLPKVGTMANAIDFFHTLNNYNRTLEKKCGVVAYVLKEESISNDVHVDSTQNHSKRALDESCVQEKAKLCKLDVVELPNLTCGASNLGDSCSPSMENRVAKMTDDVGPFCVRVSKWQSYNISSIREAFSAANAYNIVVSGSGDFKFLCKNDPSVIVEQVCRLYPVATFSVTDLSVDSMINHEVEDDDNTSQPSVSGTLNQSSMSIETVSGESMSVGIVLSESMPDSGRSECHDKTTQPSVSDTLNESSMSIETVSGESMSVGIVLGETMTDSGRSECQPSVSSTLNQSSMSAGTVSGESTPEFAGSECHDKTSQTSIHSGRPSGSSGLITNYFKAKKGTCSDTNNGKLNGKRECEVKILTELDRGIDFLEVEYKYGEKTRVDISKKRTEIMKDDHHDDIQCPYSNGCSFNNLSKRTMSILRTHLKLCHQRYFTEQSEPQPVIVLRFANGESVMYAQCGYCIAYYLVGYENHFKYESKKPGADAKWDCLNSKLYSLRNPFHKPFIRRPGPEFFDETFGNGSFKELGERVEKSMMVDIQIRENVKWLTDNCEPKSNFLKFYIFKSEKQKKIYVGSTCQMFTVRCTKHVAMNNKVAELLKSKDLIVSIFGKVDKSQVPIRFHSVKSDIEHFVVNMFSGKGYEFLNTAKLKRIMA